LKRAMQHLKDGRRVAIIGAGPAGLVSAKTMMERGFDVTVYEIGSVVGGTWVFDNDNGRNFIYRNLHINTSKKLTAFEGLPFDASVQRIPDHHDMARYLQGYAKHFGLEPRIRLRSEVLKIAPRVAADQQNWEVEAADGSSETYHIVIVCSGPYTRPLHAPEIRDNFRGEYVHSADYRVPEAFTGKRVCIIGAANSAVDVASDICTTAKSVTLVARSPVFIMPHILNGREMFDVLDIFQKRYIPDRIRKWAIKKLVRAVHGDMVGLGFKAPTHRIQPTISSTIVQDIMFERVLVKQGIASIDGRMITFVDGSASEFDTIVAATGFIKEFPFLDDALLRKDGSHLELYKRIVAPEHVGLYFVGMINVDTPINHALEQQAKWIGTIEGEQLPLPGRDDMLADIEDAKRWAARTFGGSQRHTLQEDRVRYFSGLRKAVSRARRRKLMRGIFGGLGAKPDALRDAAVRSPAEAAPAVPGGKTLD
jgi:dimethylaniline monooxygenase (N-oxide forming)